MKKMLCMLMAFLLCGQLLGCGSGSEDSVIFYYCRDPESYQYFSPDAVMAPEERDLSEHKNDLNYLLRLYLAGPLDEDLQSPFPKSARLIQAQHSGNIIQIELSGLDTTMTDAAFSLACACLAKTCTGFWDCTEVTILSGSRSITMNEESIVLFDGGAVEATNGGQP